MRSDSFFSLLVLRRLFFLVALVTMTKLLTAGGKSKQSRLACAFRGQTEKCSCSLLIQYVVVEVLVCIVYINVLYSSGGTVYESS